MHTCLICGLVVSVLRIVALVSFFGSVRNSTHKRRAYSLDIGAHGVPNEPSIFISAGSGFACFASSSSLADRRSCLAVSAGPKMLAALRWLLNFLLLDRELLAMIAVVVSLVLLLPQVPVSFGDGWTDALFDSACDYRFGTAVKYSRVEKEESLR